MTFTSVAFTLFKISCVSRKTDGLLFLIALNSPTPIIVGLSIGSMQYSVFL